MQLPVKRIAIQDANILIDLVNIGLFSHCLALEFRFCTTELILGELNESQTTTIKVHVHSGKFEIITITADQLLEIQLLSLEDSRLSEQDWSAIYFAEQQSALLLSGDKIMRKVAERKALEVRGILWILDELVRLNVITKEEACNFLQKLMALNQRLPADECQKRIDLWCK